MARKDIYKDGVKFGSGQDPTKGGRPPKLETVLKKHFLGAYGERLSNSQVQELIESLLSCSIEEMNQMAKDKDLPFWVMLIIKKAHKDYEKGSMEVVEKLLDRAHGKPKQQGEEKDDNNTNRFQIIINSKPLRDGD